MLSARGSQREADRLGDKPGSGLSTPRGNSSLKLAGLDLTNLSQSRHAALPKTARKGVDTVPHIRECGKPGEVKPWACEGNIITATPTTPTNRSEVQQRHKRRTEPGESSRHWGMKLEGTHRPCPLKGYGAKSNVGESAEQTFTAGQKLGIAEYVQSRGEAIYQTVKMEPLGESWNRGHVLPQATKENSFMGFGKAILLDPFDAKESIFPRDEKPEKEEDLARYKKTHGAFETGEAISREYAWPKKIVDDEHFSFGKTDAKPGDLMGGGGAKTALTMDLEADRTYPKTRIGNQTAECYRQVANDSLGASRNMLQGRPPVQPGHAYGLKSGADSTHAGELVRGFYTPAEQMPDHDLGACQIKGRRNFHTRRPFGTPSVRHDLEPPPVHKRSVASSTNYGDDHSAFGLLYPQKFGFRGVSDSDFFDRRPADEMHSLLKGAGYAVEDQDFRMLWADAVRGEEDGEELVSLTVMLQVLGHWLSTTGAKTSQFVAPSYRQDALDTLLPAVSEA